MIKLPLTLAVVCNILLLASCATNKPIWSSIRPGIVDSVGRFENLSYISLIEKGNKMFHNDSLSKKSQGLFREVVVARLKDRLVHEDLIVTNPGRIKDVVEQIQMLCLAVDNKRSLQDKKQAASSIKLPPTLDSILEENDMRYGLITVSTGFTRRKGNFGGQVAKGVAIGILTLGMAVPTPIKSNSTLYVLIIDSETNKVVFFHKSILTDKEPLDRAVLMKQFNDAMDGHVWEAPGN